MTEPTTTPDTSSPAQDAERSIAYEHLQGEKILVGLWMANRAARRLRRQLRKHQCRRAGITAPCPACNHVPYCRTCERIAILDKLIGRADQGHPLGVWVGRAAKLAPVFDFRRRTDQLEHMLHRLRGRDDEDMRPTAPQKKDGALPGDHREGHQQAHQGEPETGQANGQGEGQQAGSEPA